MSFARILALKYVGQPRDKKGQFSHTWQKVSHNFGSNEGGIHIKDGEKHYVKFPKNPDQVHAEVASDKIHELLGVKTISHEAHTIRGRTASVTKWRDDIQPLGHAGWRNLDEKQKQQAANTFIASALTKNWDLVGLTYDNMATDKHGDIHIVDTGGSFSFRAMGDHKDFDSDANKEIDTFLNPEKTSGRVFEPLMRYRRDLFNNAANKLKDVSREDFEKATSGMKNQKQVVDTLMERRKVIMYRFGVNDKSPKV